jgi:hypothetical protein
VTSVPPPPAAPPSAPSAAVPAAACEACGHAFDVIATICPRCGFPRGGAKPVPTIGGRSARKAWWLSLAWPGAGHLYARDTQTGAIFCGVSALICVLSATIIGPTLGVIVWLALYTALDAGRSLEIR